MANSDENKAVSFSPVKGNKLTLYFLILILLCCSPSAGEGNTRDSLSKRYSLACAYYNDMNFNNELCQKRTAWLVSADKFRKIYHKGPTHKKGEASLYRLGRIYEKMFHRFQKICDLKEAVAYYEDVHAVFPDSRLADDALFRIAGLKREQNKTKEARKYLSRIIKQYPDGDMHESAEALLYRPEIKTIKAKKTPEKHRVRACLTSPVRYWSNPDYTRITIRVSDQVDYRDVLLPDNEKRPKRLYIDLQNCSLASNLKDITQVDDGLLKRIRTGQFNKNTVRVVLDTESLQDYKIFELHDPYRIVIDVIGAEATGPSPNKPTDQDMRLAEQADREARTIILDPGHGGKDPGAISPSGKMEKDLTLKIAKKAADILNKKQGYKVILTRTEDVFLPLEERTALANSRKADLFISIHANSASDPQLQGIETYYLSAASNSEERRAAARENASSASRLSDLQKILDDLVQKNKKAESRSLAKILHQQFLDGLGKRYNVNDLGVRKAPFIVLLGARMPAVLLETGFMSNLQEEKRLSNQNYQKILAGQISKGIMEYASNLNLASRF